MLFPIDELKNGNVNIHATSNLLSIFYDPSPYRIWSMRVALDFSLRFTCCMTSAIAYIIGLTFLRFGYNSEFYNFNETSLSNEQYERTIAYTSFALCIELLIFAVCALIVAKYSELGMLTKPFEKLIKSEPSYFAFGVWTTAHIITDVFLAQLNLDNWG